MGPEELALTDFDQQPGIADPVGARETNAAEIGLGFENITLILITHFHPDHYGLAGRLVWGHPGGH